MKNRILDPLPLLDETSLLDIIQKHNLHPLHAKKIWRMLIQQNANIDDIPELPIKLREIISDKFAITTSKVISRKDARDGSTTKLLIELQDGQRIESVIMRYGAVVLEKFPKEELEKKEKFKSNSRATLCVSSQVGCNMGCTFCATGTMGLLSNLTSGEILEQLYHANKVEKIRNVVFMGMGEPLDNYSQVLLAIRAMTDVSRFGLSPCRISLSTVGVVPRMLSLIRDAPQVSLALSLHAPNQELRTQIVPTAKGWHLDRIMDAMDAFISNQNATIKESKKRHVLVEYVLIANVNDSQEVAHELGRLLEGRNVLLNVIPYNPTQVPFDYKSPSIEQTRSFVDTVKIYGIKTLQRQELGQDIASACGQLVINSQNKNKKTSCDVADLEDFGQSKRVIKMIKKKSGKKSEMNWIPVIIFVLLMWLLLKWTEQLLFRD